MCRGERRRRSGCKRREGPNSPTPFSRRGEKEVAASVNNHGPYWGKGGLMTETTKSEAKPLETPKPAPMPKEIGGPKGPEPTRYGDWEVKGRCSDF